MHVRINGGYATVLLAILLTICICSRYKLNGSSAAEGVKPIICSCLRQQLPSDTRLAYLRSSLNSLNVKIVHLWDVAKNAQAE